MLMLFLYHFIATTWACPMCAGSNDSQVDQYIIYALGGFILLTYIPFFIMYKISRKHRKKTESHGPAHP